MLDSIDPAHSEALRRIRIMAATPDPIIERVAALAGADPMAERIRQLSLPDPRIEAFHRACTESKVAMRDASGPHDMPAKLRRAERKMIEDFNQRLWGTYVSNR